MQRPVGRPMKYRSIIEKLEADLLYTPASIAAFAEEANLLESTDPNRLKLAKQRIRIALGRFSNNRQFPDEGDGMVTLRGQAPTPGWFGWRWQAAIKDP